MKKAVLLILISLMTSVLHAQEADAHIASLVNNEEWFELAEDLPLYSDVEEKLPFTMFKSGENVLVKAKYTKKR